MKIYKNLRGLFCEKTYKKLCYETIRNYDNTIEYLLGLYPDRKTWIKFYLNNYKHRYSKIL